MDEVRPPSVSLLRSPSRTQGAPGPVSRLCGVALTRLLAQYPNPARPDVLGLDVLDRHYDAAAGTLTSYRVSLLRGMMPRCAEGRCVGHQSLTGTHSWVCAITGAPTRARAVPPLTASPGGCLCLFLEKSIVDPRNRIMQLVRRVICVLRHRCISRPPQREHHV